MDPLSIAASIAGLLTITGAIVSKGYAHLSQAKKNDADVAHLLNEVASFAGILFGLQAQYNASEDSTGSPLDWFAQDSAETWQETLQTCEKTMTEIKELVESIVSSSSTRLMIKGVAMTSRVEKLLPRIERFKTLFILCLQLQNNVDLRTNTRITVEALDLLRRLAEKQDSLIQRAEAKELAELRNKIRDWLGPTTEVVQNDIVKGRDPQSCQWLLERPELSRWLELDGFTGFWLWGIQGSGKTVIVSKVIETIESGFLEQDDVVVYHYCRFSDNTTLPSERIIGALIAQLLGKLPDNIPTPERVSKIFNQHRNPSYPSLKNLQKTFHELCGHWARIFVVIDGLDEVIDREGILEFLTDLEVVGGVFKVLIASRPEIDLEVNFESYLTVPITQSDVQLDMETYVRQRMEKLCIGDDMNQELVITELVERAQGMFLWSACQIDHLSRIRTAITTDVLIALPSGLEKTFEEILLRLEEQDQTLALDILRVISFSERALDVAEVVESVAVTPKTKTIPQMLVNKLRQPNDVFQLCGSLIRKSHSTGKISLSHYSVKEFLSQRYLAKGRQNPFFLEEMPAHKAQFESCILYLSLEEFTLDTFRERLRLARDPLHADSDIPVMTNFAFLDYASNYWAHHLQQLGPEEFQEIWPFLRSFLDDKRGSFYSWILVAQYSHGDYKFPDMANAIHVAALYGLDVLLAGLLRANSATRTQQTLDGRTPLHIALENQQETAVDLLLQTEAKSDVVVKKLLSTKDKRGRTPLHTAIESGSEIAVVKLVTAGADVNAVQSDGRTPISVAVENRWDLLAEFLSEMADPIQTLSDGRSLLHIAAESGSLTWTTALLKFHTKKLIDTQDANGWTPLHYAIDREHLQIARALIKSNCSIEAYDKNNWTPLHAAIRRRNLECAALILENEWKLITPSRVNPEQRASSSRAGASSRGAATSRREEEQLASRQPGPSPSLSGKYAGELRRGSFDRHTISYSSDSFRFNTPQRPIFQIPSPLHLSVTESYTEGVELLSKHQDKLLRLGADSSEKLKCLHIALASENTQVQVALILMKMLTKWELEGSFLKLLAVPSDLIEEHLKTIFTSNTVYITQIDKAISSDQENLIPSIIRIWPDADKSTVHSAVRKHFKLAKIFIENGIEPSKAMMEGCEDPLLHSMILKEELEFARYLVENGANLEVRSKTGETPLLALAGLSLTDSNLTTVQACIDLAQILVSKGADIKALDQRSRGICHKAAAAGNDKFLEWALQALDLDPNSPDTNARTPLLLAVESGSTGTVSLLLKRFSDTKNRVVDAMEYANMRSAPLLRAMVKRPERNLIVVTFLVEADESAFKNLSWARQRDLGNLRTAFYMEALTWAIDCDFLQGFTFLLPKLPKQSLSSCRNLDGESVYSVAAAVKGDEYLKTLLQTSARQDGSGERSLNAPNANRETPLDIAIERGSQSKVALLLIHGVKPTQTQLSKAKIKGIELLEDL